MNKFMQMNELLANEDLHASYSHFWVIEIKLFQ